MRYYIQRVLKPPYSPKRPEDYPSCVLMFNMGWNDYGAKTRFGLIYFDIDGAPHYIGELKLMKRDCLETNVALGDCFEGSLGSEYCSLGMNKSYYSTMYDLFRGGNTQWEILNDLRDCSYNEKIYEEFVNESLYGYSLERDLEAEEARLQAKFLLKGGKDTSAVFSFSYIFRPEYLNGLYTKWNVKFLYDAPLFMRSVGIIGENGVGKTQMMRRLVKSLVTDGSELEPLPLFGSCITISSTPLDNYPDDIPPKTRIPFASFSIEQDKADTFKTISSCLDILSKRKNVVNKTLLPVLYQDLISDLVGEEVKGLIKVKEEGFDIKVIVNNDLLGNVTNILSSGQLQILNLLSCVCAHIHLSSLLIIDEPEIHLHPQLIEDFMASLETILQKFRSFAIIVTHSPLIVREMVGDNVYVMRILEEGIPHISKVGLETFGADPTELYTTIYGYDERVSLIAKIARELQKNGLSYEQIVAYFERYIPALGIGAKVLIRDIVS